MLSIAGSVRSWIGYTPIRVSILVEPIVLSIAGALKASAGVALGATLGHELGATLGV